MITYTEYVNGFLFSPNGTSVVLIQKNKPSWQRGLLNGVGGKIESDDTDIYAAMRREFKEETGMTVKHWERTITLVGSDWKVYFFRAFGDLTGAKSTTDEVVSIWPTHPVPEHVIPNLKWLIPLSLDDSNYFPIYTLRYKT